jgi:pyruvate/2-oxoglutarate dehydrogenase complex dihydrolipoamide acyltransferase (E2) component
MASGSQGQPGYEVRRIAPDRLVVLDWLARASRRFPVHGLVEFDVAKAKARIVDADPPVSWTGFVVATLGRAVAAHPEVNARRAGRRVLLFDRVDVGVTVERVVDGAVVLNAVAVRDADRKSCDEITAELARVKHSHEPGPARAGWAAGVARLPGPLRRAAFELAGTRPRVAATYGPAVGVTSLGMFSRGWGWAVPIPPLTVIATVGGVVDRAVVRDGQVVVRPLLPLTLSFDHAVVDGAPATRFVETLRELTETAAVFDPGR